jgi:hypothetical protein
LFYHVFGRFSMRGVQKRDKKCHQKKSDPGPFSYSDPPTHHGGHRFCFFCRPLGRFGIWYLISDFRCIRYPVSPWRF